MIDVLNDLQKTYEDTRKDKAEEIARLEAGKMEAAKIADKATAAMSEAVAIANSEAYGKAKVEKMNAENSIEMYNTRLDQIRNGDFITEGASDMFIDSVLEAEDHLNEEYKAEVERIAAELKAVTNAYKKSISDAETIINSWCHNIHANYRTFKRSMYKDPKTGEMTDRSPRPEPVHGIFRYEGIKEAYIAETFINHVGV